MQHPCYDCTPNLRSREMKITLMAVKTLLNQSSKKEKRLFQEILSTTCINHSVAKLFILYLCLCSIKLKRLMKLCWQKAVMVFTLFSVRVMPARKITLAMKRLMQRCRWMVVLGLWMERIIENVKMQMNRQISERDRPTQVIRCSSKCS